jgi:hypothetical protein
MKRMLVMEFNELCPSLIDRFIEEGELPNFAKLKSESVVNETETDARGEDLNPWVQWVDVHTGMDWEQHGIKQLNALHDFNGKFTWDALSEQFGLKNWICGSMNASYSSSFKGRFMPDPWCNDIKPSHNDEMLNYYKYVSHSVQNHSANHSVSQYDFAKSLLKQGVSLAVMFGLFKQLFNEKLLKRDDWKRAMWLDKIQFEVFQYYYKKEKPEFCTFFSNAVAHFQHHYWLDFEPEKFGQSKDKANTNTRNAILAAYRNTDYLVGKLRNLVGEETAIVFTSALSQEPYTKNERHYYNMLSPELFSRQFNIPAAAKYKPIMAEQFYLEMPDETSALQLEQELGQYVMDSMEYFHVGTNKLFLLNRDRNILSVQCRCTKYVKDDATYFSESTPEQKLLFIDAFYRMDEIKTGMHNPVGLYWTKSNKQLVKSEQGRVKPSQIHHDILSYFSS